MKLALTAGGTGGHILPALVVLDAVMAAHPETDVRFFGPEDRGERASVEARGLAFEAVPSAQVRGRGPLALARSFLRLAGGIITATCKLRAFGPDVVFSTGGYGSFPCSVAARLLRKPLVVYLPDVTPGWAVRAEQRLATRMATTTEAALAHLPKKKTSVTGYPVRADFDVDRGAARTRCGLKEDDLAVVVAGATQGAQAINRAVFAALHSLLETATVFHITGPADLAQAEALKNALASELAAKYQPAAFREDLPILMVASDLGIMRAGASVLGELPAAALPAILVPGTFAGGHQRDNARWLVDAGAAVIVEEAEIASLATQITSLLADRARLAAMRTAAAAAARRDAAARIAEIIAQEARR